MRRIAIVAAAVIGTGIVGCSQTLDSKGAVDGESMIDDGIKQHDLIYSNKDPQSRPIGVRKNKAIKLVPAEAAFRIPAAWVDWYEAHSNNIHLARKELDEVAEGAGEWDTEFASVVNATLPIDCCAGHVGSEGWGKNSVGFTDLQVRVYDMENNSPADIEAFIRRRGVREVERFTRRPANTALSTVGQWERGVLQYHRFYRDYGGTAFVDFRFRGYAKRTMVFVFMYTDATVDKHAIDEILDSFVYAD